jgi:hypothetical protein
VTTAVLTPFTRSAAQQAGAGLWRKRVLPVGEVEYKGRMLKFTRDYLGKIADAFRARAYDQVPFQLAPDDNKHTNDVERFGGSITDMTVGDDGLYVTVQPTSRGARVLAENPELGVSARIVEEYQRSDGRFFPAAIQHVLGTLDPRIPGLGGWQAVEASSDVTDTLDLSNLSFAQEEGPGQMPDMTAEQQAKLARLLEIPDEQFNQLIAGLTMTDAELNALTGGNGDGNGNGSQPDEDDELAAMIAGMSDEELAGLEQQFQAETAGAAQTAGLSYEAAMAIEMANATALEAQRGLGVITTELDNQRWENERRKLLGKGIPFYIADLAQPLLHGAPKVIEMSSGQSVDAAQVMRRVLDEVGKTAALLDMSDELGSPLDEPEGQAAGATARDELISRAKNAMGLVR